MKKKYIVHPWAVTSKNDKQVHYLSAHKLIKLDNVRSNECIIRDSRDISSIRGLTIPEGLIHLYPRNKGDYTNYGKINRMS